MIGHSYIMRLPGEVYFRYERPEPAEDEPDHPHGHLEIRDRPPLDRLVRDHVPGRVSRHVPRVAAGGKDLAGSPVDGDHRRLCVDDSAAGLEHERVRRTEVEGEIAPKRAHDPITQ